MSCGNDKKAIVVSPQVPADLLAPVPGYQGPRPSSEGQFAQATAETVIALGQCNLQLEAIGQILSLPD